MRTWLFFVGIFYGAGATALSCPGELRAKVERTITLPAGLGFFMRGSPATREVSFIDGSNARQGQILNLDTSDQIKISSDMDPVISPDGKLLTIPQQLWLDPLTGRSKPHPQTAKPSEPDFYLNDGKLIPPMAAPDQRSMSLAEARAQKKTIAVGNGLVIYRRTSQNGIEVGYVDQTMHGGYQSVGVLRNAEAGSTYRVLMYDEGLFARDYHRDAQTNQVAPAGDRRRICPAITNIAMPVLSKNGRELSYYDYEQRATRVMSIDDRGGCAEVDSIPAYVGKPDFSPSGRRMAFHVDQAAENLDNMLRPAKSQKLGAYVFDRDTKSLSAVEDLGDANSYYPIFLAEDELAFVRSPAAVDSAEMQIQTVRLEALATTRCRGCDDGVDLRATAAVLGALRGNLCGTKDLMLLNAVIGLSNLTAEECYEITANAGALDIRKFNERLGQTSSNDSPATAELSRAAGRVNRAQLAALCSRFETLTRPATGTGSAK